MRFSSLVYWAFLVAVLPAQGADPALGTLKTIPYPNPSIAADCDPTYREGMAGALKRVWDQCQRAGSAEPSVCQRRIFNHCVKTGRSIAEEATATCESISLAGELTRNDNGLVESQRSSYQSGERLNEKAQARIRRYADKLRENGKAMGDLATEGSSVLDAGACRDSTAAAEYQKLAKKIQAEITETNSFLDRLREKKEENFRTVTKNENALEKQREDLKSISAKVPKTALREKAPAAIARQPLMMNAAGVTPAKLVGYAPTGDAAAVDSPPPDAYFAAQPTDGIVEQIEGGAVGSVSAVSTATPISAPAAEAYPKPRPRPKNLNGLTDNEMKLSAPGAVLFTTLKIRVDSAFLDRERIILAKGIDLMPRCVWKNLVNGTFRRKKSPPNFYGKMYMYDRGVKANSKTGPVRYWVELDPAYRGGQTNGLVPSMLVHELFHAVGFSENNGKLKAYVEKFGVYSDGRTVCPVSQYAASSFKEDFAEAGTQMIFPKGGVGGYKPDACARKKVKQMKEIIGC